MIIKGTSCAGARRLAVHLTRTDTNERAEVREIRGVTAEDLRGALLEMEAVSAGARTTKPFYHASINTREGERLTDEQRAHAIDTLEAALGYTGQPRVVVVHEKKDREHCHIVWSRIDLDRMAAISDSHNYRKHEEVARALEREFGLERVQGAHVERDGKERPGRTPSHREMLQAERTGISAAAAKAKMTELWQRTASGQEFRKELEKTSWMLARGDRRDLVVIDINGGVHSLARRIEGAKAADVRERFADIDPKSLPSVAEAKQIQAERQTGRAQEAAMYRAEVESAVVRPAAAKAQMTDLWHKTGSGQEFRNELEKTSWMLARDERNRLVAIDAAGSVHGVAHRIPGATEADVRRRFADLDPKSLPSVAEAKQMQGERQRERAQEAAVFRAEAESAIVRPAAAKAQMTDLWHKTGSGQEFRKELEKTSWMLARDERGRVVAIDAAGSVHGVAHRISGATEADVRRRFADLDLKSVPSITEAQKIQHGRQNERAQQSANLRLQQSRPNQPNVRAADQPRERGRAGRGAGAVASKIGGSIFSALMGEKPTPKVKEPDSTKQGRDAATPSSRRQELMRQLSREIPSETERDAEFERDRIERDRGRERTRG